MRKIVYKLWEVKRQAALDFANLHHRYASRKETGTPYIIHPLQVVDRLGVWGIQPEDHPDVWVAGLLHDVDEDTAATIYEIEALFGPTVARYVSELTFREQYPDESKEDYAKAKEEYLGTFAWKSIQSLIIKISDRMCNVEDYLRKEKNQRYAVKYFDKAKPLFDAHTSRDHIGDIEAIFGSVVAHNVFVDIVRLSSRIDTLRRTP